MESYSHYTKQVTASSSGFENLPSILIVPWEIKFEHIVEFDWSADKSRAYIKLGESNIFLV